GGGGGVVGGGEGADLPQQGLAAGHAEPRQRLADLPRAQISVAVREWIDGRRQDVHRDAEPALEPGQREDRRVVLLGEAAEERPCARLRRRAVEVTVPHPPARAARSEEHTSELQSLTN